MPGLRRSPAPCEHPNRIANYDDISCETCGHVLTDEQTRVIEFVCGQYEHRGLTGGPNALRPLLAGHSRDVTKMAADHIGDATEKAAEQPSEDKRDAERYRWLRRAGNTKAIAIVDAACPVEMDAAMRAAIAKGETK